jgi:hypothetical protein
MTGMPMLPHELITRRAPRGVPLWVAPAFLVLAAALLPWIGWLFTTLPDEATAAHWRLAWGGFDVGLACALGATGILIVRRSRLTQVAATVAATMLICDAWFDVLTSHGATNVTVAAVLAGAVELPLALFCVWIVRSAANDLG